MRRIGSLGEARKRGSGLRHRLGMIPRNVPQGALTYEVKGG
jgi:hypothetical protein